MNPAATGSSTITGTATSCSSFYACAYTITGAQGNGSAATYPYSYAYNSYADFQLPGELQSTASPPYNATIVGNVGNTYQIKGSFTAIDANTGKVVSGTTNDQIVRIQHCSRTGCYYSYALSTGGISFILKNLDGTSTSVACTPQSFPAGSSAKCTATVTDLANSASFPTGNISFSSPYSGDGTFTPRACALSSGSCSVTFTASDNAVGTVSINAKYPGDSSHYKSSASTAVNVTGN